DRDSMHTTRVWLLRPTESVCGHCSSGCNINIETWSDQVRRITPRENQQVNRWWMCDEGRLRYKEASASTRVSRARAGGAEVPFLEALSRAQELVRGAHGGVVGLTTGHASNEELFVLKTLVGKGPIAVAYAPDGATFKARDG